MAPTPTVQEILRGSQGRREKERLRQQEKQQQEEQKQQQQERQRQDKPRQKQPATPSSSSTRPPPPTDDNTHTRTTTTEPERSTASSRGQQRRRLSTTLPEHLRPTSDESSDADAEYSDDDDDRHALAAADDAAARGQRSLRARPPLQAIDMNRSLFSMIRAAGSAAAASWLDDAAGDSDSDPDASAVAAAAAAAAAGGDATGLAASAPAHMFLRARKAKGKRLGTIEERTAGVAADDDEEEEEEDDEDDDPDGSGLAESQMLRRGGEEAPFLSMMLKGEKDMEASMTLDSPQDVAAAINEPGRPSPVSLAQRLMEIFELDEPEEVVAEYPCLLLQTVLLNGHMYITKNHICFYAYLPRNPDVVVKRGYLAKRGRHDPRYTRYHSELKDGAVRFYDNASQIYTPKGSIDLRFSISAMLDPDSKKPKDEILHIKLVTRAREYWLKADSPQEARDWVKQLQRMIFKCHNDGDSVKICIPIKYIFDLEESQFLDVSDTVKVKVIDHNESYAVDEYYFAFFDVGPEPIALLKKMVTPAAAKSTAQIPPKIDPHRFSPSPFLKVRSTLRPPVAPDSPSRRSSSDSQSSSRSGDNKSRSRSVGRRRSQKQPRPRDSTATATTTGDEVLLDAETGSSTAAGVQSFGDETSASPSQILSRSDVFQAPTRHEVRDDEEGGSGSGESSAARRRSLRRRLSRNRRSADSGAREPAAPSVSATTASAASAASPSTMFPSAGLTDLVRAAGAITDRSKRMSSRLATGSIGIFEKVTGMWQAEVRHYGPAPGMPADDDDKQPATGTDSETFHRRYRQHFALPSDERLIATYWAFFYQTIPLYGKIYLSKNYFCFRSLIPSGRKLVLPLKDVESTDKDSTYRRNGLVITIRGHEEIFFDFIKADHRDDCGVLLTLSSDAAKREDKAAEGTAADVEYNWLKEARGEDKTDRERNLIRRIGEKGANAPPILFDDPKASVLHLKPDKPMRITCLTIGSRGDVQPYIALAKALMADGHHVRIATHVEFEEWIRSHGIDFKPVVGDPGELMRICIEYGMFTYQFLREASSKFMAWIDELLVTAWDACQDTDLLIESPPAMAGIHIAEALQIPYFRAFTMPWTRTRAYPHAFAVPSVKRGGTYNFVTYIMIENIFWRGVASNINRWRRKTLQLPPTTLDRMQTNKVPFLYNFSPEVVPRPLDYSDWTRVTGYWFLDEGAAATYRPPADLVEFMARARSDGKKIIYVGFGSILVDDPAAMEATIVAAVRDADVRCILARGWSARATKAVLPKAGPASAAAAVLASPASSTTVPGATSPLPPASMLPDFIYSVGSIPHDWLFPRIDAVVHHGGSGTTGASLRAGVPTVAKPFFGDQFFFAARLEDLGVGLWLRKWAPRAFGRAIWKATREERMIERAREIGARIRAETGVENAVKAIYHDLEYARSLVRKQGEREERSEIDEHWTMVEADSTEEADSGEEEREREAAEEGFEAA